MNWYSFYRFVLLIFMKWINLANSFAEQTHHYSMRRKANIRLYQRWSRIGCLSSLIEMKVPAYSAYICDCLAAQGDFINANTVYFEHKLCDVFAGTFGNVHCLLKQIFYPSHKTVRICNICNRSHFKTIFSQICESQLYSSAFFFCFFFFFVNLIIEKIKTLQLNSFWQ